MPDKKPARDLTKDEAMERVFPKKVRDKLREVAHEKDKNSETDSSRKESTT